MEKISFNYVQKIYIYRRDFGTLGVITVTRPMDGKFVSMVFRKSKKKFSRTHFLEKQSKFANTVYWYGCRLKPVV